MKRISKTSSFLFALLMMCALMATSLPVYAATGTKMTNRIEITIEDASYTDTLQYDWQAVNIEKQNNALCGEELIRQIGTKDIFVFPDTGVKSKSWLWIVLVAAAAVCAVALLLTKKKD